MSSRQKKTILFFGETSDKLHGVSVSNRLNLSILEGYFEINAVEETSRVGSGFLNKIEKLVILSSELYELSLAVRVAKPNIFYYVFSNSLLGFLKNSLILGIVNLFSKNTQIVTHLHRGDILNGKSTILFKRISIFLLNRSDYIICLECSQAKLINELCQKPALVLKNTVDEAGIFQRAKRVFNYTHRGSSNLSSSNIPVKILVIANYLESKNIFNVAKIISESVLGGKVEVNFYGNYTRKFNKHYVQEFSDNMVGINFLGPIHNHEKVRIFLDHDFLLMPSINEGVPIVILEAMAIGCPVISMNVGYISDLLGSDYPLLIRKFNTDGIGEILKLAVDLPENEWRDISKTNKERYEHFYSNAAHSETLVELFSGF